MRVYHEQIVGNTVAYIAKTYYEKTHMYPAQMLVYKLLALMDFNSVKTKGRPCTELTYKARKNGPVPEELYKDSEEKYKNFYTVERFPLPNGKSYKRYKAMCEPDTDYLCPSELEFLNQKINLFVTERFNSRKASEYSHQNIKAWRKAAYKKINTVIDYAAEFDDDIYSKPLNKLSMPEEQFLLYREYSKCQK